MGAQFNITIKNMQIDLTWSFNSAKLLFALMLSLKIIKRYFAYLKENFSLLELSDL